MDSWHVHATSMKVPASEGAFCSHVNMNSFWKRNSEFCPTFRENVTLQIYQGNTSLRNCICTSSFLNAHLKQRAWPLQPGRTQWSNWTKAAPEMYAGQQWTRGQKQSIWCLGKKAHTGLIPVSPVPAVVNSVVGAPATNQPHHFRKIWRRYFCGAVQFNFLQC